MIPANGSVGKSLPLTLSWIPGAYTETYDLYIWDSTASQPAIPYKTDISGISFVIPQNAFAYNATYKWRLVSKNPCHQIDGPIYTFRLVPLPDLMVSSVLAPTTAISGQNISITWTVKNIGPGATMANENWQDFVYLSFDTIPNFNVPPNFNPNGWALLDFPVRLLLLAAKTNVTALQPGEQYSNTVNFTLPVNYDFTVYAYVFTNGNNSILEVAKDNNAARAVNPIVISLAPTPDLRVDSVFAPATVFSGATINVAYKVKNYGVLTPATSSWSDQVYLSQSILFDSANAIKLKFPKGNGTYYPNTENAVNFISTQLQHDSSFYRSISCVIPNEIFGNWFVHVKTNNTGSLYEGPNFLNNVNNNPVQIFLTPTPHLTVNSLDLPLTEASTTQPIGLNWVIKNTGLTDNFEKNQGHYLLRRIGNCNGPTRLPDFYGRTEGQGTVVEPLPLYFDSSLNVQGSSYWLDKIYISTDSTGLDMDNAQLVYTYKNGTQQYAGAYFRNLGCGIHGAYNVDHAILPNRSFANNANFQVPQNLAPGTYYMYVYTNATKTVFEYPGTAEIKRSGPLEISRPDVIAGINTPSNAVAGTPVQINYTITNNGPGNVYNHLREDKIYVSNNPVFNASATLIATKTYTENIWMGSPVSHSIPYTLHPSQSGTRYFFVKTNTSYAFAETDSSNNLSNAGTILFATAAPVDLIVSQIATPDTVLAGVNASIRYTVNNNGSGAGTGLATDSFFVSCSSAYSPATAYFIGKRDKYRNLLPGASVTDTFTTVLPFTFQLNACFTNDESNKAYFFVKTNATDSIYEGANSLNNLSASTQKVIKNVLVDLKVNSVNAPASAIVGRSYSLNYKIQNIGQLPSIGYGNATDSIYISPDSVLNSNAIPFGKNVWSERLYGSTILSKNISNNFVNVPTGDYYVLVKTNADIPSSLFAERNFNNNVNLIRDISGAAQKVSVVRPPLPDLIDSIISYPAMASPGQPITIIHRIKNIGAGESYPNSFRNIIRLTDNPLSDYGLYDLGVTTKFVIIPPGGFVDDTLQIFLPTHLTARNYSLINYIDVFNDVVETNDLNNRAAVFINIFNPEPVDFLVNILQAVDTVELGYGLDSIHYTIKNNSINPAVGYTTDGFYLSSSPIFDSTSVLIGIKNKNINMQPLALDTIVHAPIVSGVTEGNYYLFVNTDIMNSIPETNETNNTAVNATPVYVKVKELSLDLLETNTLTSLDRYYKLIIPDSLYGATISVKLVSNDSLTKINQMFIGKNYIPSAAHFDYSYPTANYGNQNIIMTYTTSGVYYITIRCVNTGNTIQNINLLARKLPFEISNVASSTGGNIGNVTVKISGSLFTQGMTARLNKTGTQIDATAIYFLNSTEVFATFPLQGKPLGAYDVTLSKGDTSIAVLNNGFSVVTANNGGLITGGGNNTGAGNGDMPGCDPGAASGLNSQLITEIVVPAKVLAGWPFVIQINYSNPTNYDIPAQVRTLYAEDFVKLARTKEELPNGTSNLTLQISEPNGPPGVIRAGGSGTLLIYGKPNANVPGHTFTMYTFK